PLPEPTADYPPRPAEPPKSPEPEYKTYFAAVGPVAEDTQLTDENFGRLFEPYQALTLPPGAVGAKAEALAQYLQRPLGKGHVLPGDALGPKRVVYVAPPPTLVVPPAPVAAPPPREPVKVEPERQVVRTLTVSGVRFSFYERWPGGEWKLLREVF